MTTTTEPPLKPLLLFILLLTLITVTVGCTQTTTPPVWDDFTFTTILGETRNLSDYRGSPVLLDFMGVGCDPCRREMNVLSQLHHDYPTLTIISIDVWTTQGETAQSIQQLKKDFLLQNITLDWTFALDDAQGSLAKKYAITAVPYLVLYTKQGNLYYSHLGYEEYSTLAPKVEAITS